MTSPLKLLEHLLSIGVKDGNDLHIRDLKTKHRRGIANHRINLI